MAGQFPGPLTELDFWSSRAAALASLHEQLDSERIREALQILETARSTFLPAFSRLTREVETARAEAADNLAYLKPLRKHLERMGVHLLNLLQCLSPEFSFIIKPKETFCQLIRA